MDYLIPVLLYAAKFEKIWSLFKMPKPQIKFLVALWCPIFLSFVLVIGSNKVVRGSLAETREMLYAFFIIYYIYLYLTASFPKVNSLDAAK